MYIFIYGTFSTHQMMGWMKGPLLENRSGLAGHGLSSLAQPGQAWPGLARPGYAWPRLPRHGQAQPSRPGSARPGQDCPGPGCTKALLSGGNLRER